MAIGMLSTEYIIESNLIEGVKSRREVPKSMTAWKFLSSVDILTKEIVLDVHKLVMYGLLQRHIGEYRSYNVTVGKRSCPHWLLVEELMNDWLREMAHWQDLDPKTKHVDFEYIHPFVDGNGRIGRLLMWWHEAKLGLPLTLITYDSRFLYFDWFKGH